MCGAGKLGGSQPTEIVSLLWKEIRFCGFSKKAKCVLKEYKLFQFYGVGGLFCFGERFG